jgi:glycine cleavage system H protein
VKAVSECYVPVAGKVVEINESIKETPSQINKSPFDQGK